MSEPPCGICGAETTIVGTKRSDFSGRTYELRHCGTCRFSFVANPWTDYGRIYSDEYYAGRGADPLANYVHETTHWTSTVRRYEWLGILKVVGTLVSLDGNTRWLDYGCGNGGLVRYATEAGHRHVFGYDTGAMAESARLAGLAILDDRGVQEAEGTFDIVTAIEVIEHVPDPLALLAAMRRLLKPGGLLFLTTGNARPCRGRLLSWSYVLPDVHVSFFEPETLERAMEKSGFRPERRGRLPGYAEIIRFKVLKNLKVRERNLVERLVPWPMLAAIVDARVGVSAHPVGWAK